MKKMRGEREKWGERGEREEKDEEEGEGGAGGRAEEEEEKKNLSFPLLCLLDSTGSKGSEVREGNRGSRSQLVKPRACSSPKTSLPPLGFAPHLGIPCACVGQRVVAGHLLAHLSAATSVPALAGPCEMLC